MLVIDYFSSYVEVAKLSSTTSPDVTAHLQSMFARHGIPKLLISDNGSQFSSTSFAKFAKDYEFINILTSPRYPQAKRKVERAFQSSDREESTQENLKSLQSTDGLSCHAPRKWS